MRTITISGNLGRDAETRETSNGTKVANFSVAVRQNQPDEDGNYGTDWFRCSVWGNRASVIERFYKKGSHVTVSGDLSISEYKEQTQLDVNVNSFDLPDSNSKQQGKDSESKAKHKKPNSDPFATTGGPIDISDDDLPF